MDMYVTTYITNKHYYPSENSRVLKTKWQDYGKPYWHLNNNYLHSQQLY